MSFLRHREIYQVETGGRGRNRGYARTSRLDESPVGYSLAGCSPAEPASASPTGGTLQQWCSALQLAIRCYLKTTLSRGLTLGAHPSFRYEEPFQRFSLLVWAKAVETAAWVAQGLPITGLKPRCE